jgi:hypothetical protein
MATPGPENKASRLSLSANGVRLLGFERGYAEVNAEQYTSGEELLWLFTSTRKP